MASINQIVGWNGKLAKAKSSDKTYNALIASLPVSEFPFIRGEKKEIVIPMLERKLLKMYEAQCKVALLKPSTEDKEGKYVARLFRGMVCVWKDSFQTDFKANEAVANRIVSDSSITRGTVEAMGIVCEIDRMKASGILGKKVAPTVTKKLSYGGGRLWMKASQTRVIVSRG